MLYVYELQDLIEGSECYVEFYEKEITVWCNLSDQQLRFSDKYDLEQYLIVRKAFVKAHNTYVNKGVVL